MSSAPDLALLGPNDPSPVDIFNPGGRSEFLLIGDHAGNLVPKGLFELGLPKEQLERHIGWDIGVAALARQLAVEIDACFIAQRYSRLVIDCNRAPDAPDAIPAVSDGTSVPGNAALTAGERGARVVAIHEPYQQAIGDELERRDGEGRSTTLIALHSFTPTMNGISRPWHAGVLHDQGNTIFALAVLERLREDPDLVVGDNEPYRMDLIDFTVPCHAYAAHRPYLELEVRQDLLGSAEGIASWCRRLAALLGRLAQQPPPVAR